MVLGQSGFGSGSEPGTTSDAATDDVDVNGTHGAQHGDDWQNELLPKLTIKSLFRGWEGTLVMGLGVLFPSLLVVLFSLTCMDRLALLMFNHPLEILAELLLIINIPIAIFITWSNLMKGNHAYSLVRGVSLGAAIGTSLIIMAVSIVAVVLSSNAEPTIGTVFALLVVPSLLAAVAGAYVVNKVRCTRDFASSRARVLAVTGAGMLFAILSFLGAEAKPWGIRMAEHQAVSASAVDQRSGLDQLMSFFPEREMLIECSDARAVGLCGLFLPLTVNSQRELYFAMTGEPFSFRDINNKDLASVSDESLARQVVGEQIKDLSLLRSSMTGVIHPDTLSSTVDWTFVFKNDGVNPAEARAEIAIPHGAVVTRLTVWSKGEPHDAGFTDPSKFASAWNWHEKDVSSMVTDLGRGRMLVSCTGIQGQSELKLRMTTIVPIKPDGATRGILALPKFVASNFQLSGEHQLRLRSPMLLSGALSKMKAGKTGTGEHVITADLEADDLTSSNLMLTAQRPSKNEPIAVSDESAFPYKPNTGTSYVVQYVKAIPASIPSQLIVVLDGSVKMEKYRNELADSLRKLPPNVPTLVILATNEASTKYEPLTVNDAIAKLKQNKFVRGQDNLKAMIKAAEVAGESRGGAVLWIHGPQSATNREIYIVGQYDARPRFYDLPLESGDTDTNEFFRNYSEIGPFEQVPRNSSLASDLEYFFGKWRPGSSDYLVARARVSRFPDGAKLSSNQYAKELCTLWANDEASSFLARGARGNAAQLGLERRFVNRACSAFLAPEPEKSLAITPKTVGADSTDLVETTDVAANENATANENASANENVSANANENVSAGENGSTVSSPQTQTDVTYITGMNSGGTVRVNNLANLEAFLNIVSNGVEILGVVAGIYLFTNACLVGGDHEFVPDGCKPKKKTRMGRVGRMMLAGVCIVIGLATPGSINWLVASARDANLFS